MLGAAIWGVVWYPYRQLAAAGISGAWATLLTYGVALLLALPLFRRQLPGQRIDGWLLAIALSSGACNLGYVLATLHGEVMRVLLLFYLAPLWTVLLARPLLGERITTTGIAVIGLALGGAAIMLWHPALGWPWPRQWPEWLALATGFMFALSNVLIRRADHYVVEFKAIAVFVGVAVIALPLALWLEAMPTAAAAAGTWWLVVLVAALLVAANVIVQQGLGRMPAGRAIVILTFELPVAALAAWLLAGEGMAARDWLGGSLIVGAGLVAARLED
jgi:drug/metabolite transporter (DMT)-like permease